MAVARAFVLGQRLRGVRHGLVGRILDHQDGGRIRRVGRRLDGVPQSRKGLARRVSPVDPGELPEQRSEGDPPLGHAQRHPGQDIGLVGDREGPRQHSVRIDDPTAVEPRVHQQRRVVGDHDVRAQSVA